MSENVYVLMEEGWEYNDETFFHPESGSGTPTKVFPTQEAADTECNKRNVESIRELFTSAEANQYFYNFKDIIPYDKKKDGEYMRKLEGLLEKIFDLDIDSLNEKLDNQEEIEPTKSATDEDWLAFQSMVNLNFWNVVEVEKA
jgi:hypothetical protein